MHSHVQVVSFNMRSRDAGKIRVSRSDLRDCCNHGSAADGSASILNFGYERQADDEVGDV